MTIAEAVEGARTRALYELLRQRLIKPVAIATPPVGAEINVPVPGGAVWEVLSVTFTFTTSAVVANRGVHLVATGSDGRLMRIAPPSPIAASTGSLFVYEVGGAQYGQAGVTVGLTIPIPELIIPAGGSLATLTGALDAGDAYTAVTLAVREWSPREVLSASDWLDDHVR